MARDAKAELNLMSALQFPDSDGLHRILAHCANDQCVCEVGPTTRRETFGETSAIGHTDRLLETSVGAPRDLTRGVGFRESASTKSTESWMGRDAISWRSS